MATPLTDREVLAYVERSESFYPADAVDFSIEEQRRYYNALCAAFRQARPEGITVRDGTLPGPAGPLPVRRYLPGERRTDSCLLYFHGGGFILGGLESHDDVCAELCARAGLEVIALDYRLCPEHPHPAPFEDAMAAFRLIAGEGRPVVLGGDSAGGNLAAAVAFASRGAAAQPKGQLLIYPALGGDGISESYESEGDAPMLTRADIDYYTQVHAGGPGFREDPTFAPLSAKNYSGLAPAAVFVAEIDPLRDDGVHYAERLRAAGVAAELYLEEQLVHGYLRARNMSRRAKASFTRICEALSRLAA